ncbi:uncharacterized protein LOC134722318 [Mytilus trossulus]|uniref:uncharacterized protein LOC134722318 n=1 Tax=Mytilus trossulus TaxID=6551 RepID=UPI003007EFEA
MFLKAYVQSQLRLYLDKDGLIRCGGRINNAPLPENAKFPYLIPTKHRLTNLLINDIHIENLHSGIGSTVTYLRQKYWIPSAQQEVGCVIRKCVSCRKVTGVAYKAQDPPPLPKDKLSSEEPFTISGVDFSGALNIKGDDGVLRKVYICLFTCANTRAIHLEIVPDIAEKSFMLASRRFISRKSIPRFMISDKATTFVAAAEEIYETDCYSADLTTNHEIMNDQAKRRSRLIEQFLARWKHEYLTSLREFQRVSGNNNQSVKLGDVVKIYDDNYPRTTWKLGVIKELTYRNENLVRSATVRTSNSKLNRPIVKLYPLEICESDSITTQTQKYQRRAKTDAVEKIKVFKATFFNYIQVK